MKVVERVTLALPKAVWEDVKRLIPSGQRSRWVAETLEAELRRRQRQAQFSQLKRLQENLRAKYGELPSSADDIEAMRAEREDEQSGLR
jgi:Skp family chaperone for outer membrane proteins